MHAESSKRWWRILTIVIPFLALTGCGEGDGPTGITNTAVAPLNLPPGFCDPINFEIECDQPAIIWFGGGQTVVIDNPDKSGINTSDSVARMQKFFDQPFGGTRLNPVEVPVDFAAGRAFKMKVWSERVVPVTFKLEETNDGSGGRDTAATHGGGSVWEELCFDFTTIGVPANPTIGLTIIFDNFVQGGAIGGVFEGDWTFYYDDITQVESCSDTPPTGTVPDVKLYDPTQTPVFPQDLEVTVFDSQSVITELFADDATYNPVLGVSSGVGYGANVAQIGFIGGDRGFLSEFASLDFKVKGMPNNVIFVKLYDSVDSLRINLTSSGYSDELTAGWYQVSIPISAFNGVSLATGIVLESDNTAPMQFTMLLNDLGFTEADDGGDGGNGGTGGSITPAAVAYSSDPAVTEDLAPPEGFIQSFGSGAVFVDVLDDPDYDQVLQTTSGDLFGGDNIGFAAFGFYPGGFAAGYETFNFKVKGDAENLADFEVKFFGPGDAADDTVSTYDLASYAGSTDLGNGWYQVSVPMSDFSPAKLAINTGFLLGPNGPQDAPFTYLMTDIGFDVAEGTGGSGSGSEVTLDAVAYSSDPAATEDLAPPEGFIQSFGSGAVFVDVLDDPDYDQVLQTTSGDLFGGDNIGFAAFGFYPGGFAAGYETFNFKVKGDAENLADFEVKFFGPGDAADDTVSTYDLASYAGSTDLGNGWYQVSVPMSDFSPAKLAINTGFLLGPNGPQDAPFTYLMTDIGFTNAGGGNGGGNGGGEVEGNIVINGGFETGAFNDGSENANWQQALGVETQSIVTDNPSSGIYAANLNVPVRLAGDPAYDTVIKNANLQAGNLNDGASVTVTWDMRGSVAGVDGAGAVIFVELFSEKDGGGTNKAEIYTGNPLVPTADWSRYSWTTSVASSAEGGAPGGLTLQLKAGCGQVVDCGVDVYFDNVSIVVGGGGG